MNWWQVFAPTSYFLAVGRLLESAGIKFLAKVTITSEDVPYHITVDFARSTNLFFHLPGKALIVRLSYEEHLGWGTPDSFDHYWSFEFICEESLALWQERLRERVAEEFRTRQFRDSLADEVPGAWDLLETEGLDGSGGYVGDYLSSPGWEVRRQFGLERGRDRRDRMRPEEVATPIVNAAKQVEPVLCDKFQSLSVWGFVPSYTFPGCEPIFWGRFSTRRLRPLANRVIGIKRRPD